MTVASWVYDTQTIHANNEARNDEIRVGGNDGVGGDRVRGDGVGGDGNKVVVGAENSIRKFNKGAENCIWKKNEYETTEKHHIFVLDRGRQYVDVKVYFYYEFRDPHSV